MELTKLFNAFDLQANLLLDEKSPGNLIGISDQKKKSWRLEIYIGFYHFCLNADPVKL